MRPALEQLSRPMIGSTKLETHTYEVEVVDFSLASTNNDEPVYTAALLSIAHSINPKGCANRISAERYLVIRRRWYVY